MSKREMIDTDDDRRYVRRDDGDKFKGSVDVCPSLSSYARHNARNNTKPGQGDRGDRKH